MSLNCPSCGSGINFRSEFTTYAVCGACDTMVVRKNIDLEAMGKVAALQPDGSPLQLESTGTFEGKAFQVIGRIQLSYGSGFWNEWYLSYSDGSYGWLGEAMGQYFLSRALDSVPGDLRTPAALSPGKVLEYEGKHWVVLDLKEVSVSSFEGELPSIISSPEPFWTVDLRAADGEGLSVDTSDGVPSGYRGRWVPFAELSLAGLKNGEYPSVAVPPGSVKAIKCPSCGAPHEINCGERSRLFVCQYCDMSLDSASEELSQLGQAMDKARDLSQAALIPIGSKARLSDGEYKVVGLLINGTVVEGSKYTWKDYLLYNHLTGYRWINESNGHYVLFEQLYEVPKMGNYPVGRPPRRLVSLDGVDYKHFQTSQVTVQTVIGEFYWRVQRGDLSVANDYVAPPYMVSASEIPGVDITWTRGRYLDREELGSIFPGLSNLPPAFGVAPAQPNPYEGINRKRQLPTLVGLLLSVFMITTGLNLIGGQTVLQDSAVELQIPPTGTEFKVEKSATLVDLGPLDLRLVLDAGLKDQWTDLEVTLTGGGQTESREFLLGDYQGSGESKGSVVFPNVSPGEVELTLKGTTGPQQPINFLGGETAKPVTLDLKLKKMPRKPVYGTLLIFLSLMSLPFLVTANNYNRVERARWYESDYG